MDTRIPKCMENIKCVSDLKEYITVTVTIEYSCRSGPKFFSEKKLRLSNKDTGTCSWLLIQHVHFSCHMILKRYCSSQGSDATAKISIVLQFIGRLNVLSQLLHVNILTNTLEARKMYVRSRKYKCC